MFKPVRFRDRIRWAILQHKSSHRISAVLSSKTLKWEAVVGNQNLTQDVGDFETFGAAITAAYRFGKHLHMFDVETFL